MKDGFINLNKLENMTSHDVVNRVRKILNAKKVGHAGTLDPFATGVLPIAVGRATKFLEYLSDSFKIYRAGIFFGIETDTSDITGKIINQVDNFKFPNQTEIEVALNKFTGKIKQVPPKYSAIKINGRKAYELARKNVEFEMPEREIFINSIKIINQNESELHIEVDCSKGTYIRALARDIGRELNLPATLKTLQRIKVGDFDIADSVNFDNLNFIPVENCLNHLPRFDLPYLRLSAYQNGLTTRINDEFAEGTVFKVYVDNQFIGTGKIVDCELKADKIFLRD